MKKNRGKKRKNHCDKVNRKAGSVATLRRFFDSLLEKYHSTHWLSSDPVEFVHRYRNSDDQEIVGLLASCFAYGSVKQIRRALEQVLAPMGENPFHFVRNFGALSRLDPQKGAPSAWPGFYYRFHKEAHLAGLVTVLGRALCEFGTIGNCFRETATGSGLEGALEGGVRWFHSEIEAWAKETNQPQLVQGLKFFFNRPSGGSSCKRLVMYFRWMVRKDEIDFGLWTWLDPSELVIPVDTHVARISSYVGLRKGPELKPPSWRMAVEITLSLRELNANDPVRYDFALARLGILDICNRKYVSSVCERCPLLAVCKLTCATEALEFDGYGSNRLSGE